LQIMRRFRKSVRYILFDDALVAQAASSFQGVLMDLTDVGIDFSSFAEAKVACSVVDGRNYGIPFDSGAAIAAYRTDILADAGYTIDDFTDITWDHSKEPPESMPAQ
jgi:lactose/L-arabinose transport system substrate-binding protein